jgi:hypothetical protein
LIFTDDKSKTAIYQIIVPKDWQGRFLAELLQETGTPNVTITRRSSVLQTDGNLQLKSGDVIYLTTTFDQVPLLRQRLTGVQEG